MFCHHRPASETPWRFAGGPMKMAFRWRADDGPFKAVFGSSIPSPKKKKKKKKKRYQIWTPLTKLSGSAHDEHISARGFIKTLWTLKEWQSYYGVSPER